MTITPIYVRAAAIYIRAAAIYAPLVAATLTGLIRRGIARQFAACLLSLMWTLCTLLILQRLNHTASWWTFASTGPSFRAMPLELYFGWAILWGVFPQLAFPRLRLPLVIALMLAVDLVAMPLCRPVVVLSPHWLTGEACALVLVLIPALCIARWTLNNTHLNLRATMQVATSGLLFLFLLPEIVFALRPGDGWSPLLNLPSWERQLGIQTLLLLTIPGISAVMEFAQRGHGTPIPYDPPQRLVTSGVYRYCANPMQFSCGIVMLFWAALLHNIWFAAVACMSILYSAGLATWDEHQDLAQRFGSGWKLYRDAVPSWRIRWRPFHAGPPARLYIARTCGPCSELRAWLTHRSPLGLTLIDAETLPSGSIQRLRYEAGDDHMGGVSVDGIRAFAHALEHLNFGWAFCGFGLRLPLVWQFVQLLMDASGLGPRILSPHCSPPVVH